jgi:hypothetical protein
MKRKSRLESSLSSSRWGHRPNIEDGRFRVLAVTCIRRATAARGRVGMGGSGVRTSFPTGPNTFSGFGFERVFSPAEILNIPDTSSLRQDLAVIFEQLGQLASN